MIVSLCMSIYTMSAFIIKLMDVVIIYLISTYVHDFVFKTYAPLSTFWVLGVYKDPKSRSGFLSQFGHTLYQPLLLPHY